MLRLLLKHQPDSTPPYLCRIPLRGCHRLHPLSGWSLREYRGGSIRV